MSERRRKEQNGEESGITVVAKQLGPQLASDQEHLIEQMIDQRKLAVLNETTQAALGYFDWRGRKISFWKRVVNWELNSSPSVGGLGRRQIIQAMEAASGAKSLEVAEKPNIISRNLTKRDWKEKATKDGKVIVE